MEGLRTGLTSYPVVFLFASNLPFLHTPLLFLLSQLVGSSSEVADVGSLHESHQMSYPLSRREGERKRDDEGGREGKEADEGWGRSSLMPRLAKDAVWEQDENSSNLDMFGH